MPEDERVLEVREVNYDRFSNYRRHYRGGTNSNNTFGGRLEKLAKIIPDNLAFVQGERRLTWRQFNERVNRLANALLALGIKKEERVGIAGFNSIEWMESFFALCRIGAVPFNLNPRFTPGETKYVLEDADAAALLVEDECLSTGKRMFDELASLRHLIVYGVGKPPLNIPPGTLVYEELMAKYPPTKPQLDYKVTNEDFSFLMYTGGTTGYPKGTVWDGEQRVKGLVVLGLNALVPVMDRLADRHVYSLVAGLGALPGLKGFHPLNHRILASRPARLLLPRIVGPLLGSALTIKLNRLLNQEGWKVLPCAPLFHGAGYEAVFCHLICLGSTTVFLPTPRHFDVREFLETVEKEKVNQALIIGDAFAVPILEELRKAKEEGKGYKLSSLLTIASSGAWWSAHVKKGLHEYIPHFVVMDMYGASESSVAFASVATSGDKEEAGAGARITPDKGMYSLQARCRVINPETGRDIEPGSGEVGEFLIGGPMALGYWKCPEKTRHDFRVVAGERYFFAGDEGVVDQKGQFRLIGRGGAQVINTGGEKVYAEEVEEAIKSHPQVRDVGVVGVPDERWGEAVTALVELEGEAVTALVELEGGEKLTAEGIIAYVGQRLSGYKKPRYVIFVDSVPREASTGKILRRELKQFARQKLSQGS